MLLYNANIDLLLSCFSRFYSWFQLAYFAFSEPRFLKRVLHLIQSDMVHDDPVWY